ncbi:hypothetical protein BDV18DRAFT_130921 [Aspergillus unguis]
MGSYTFRWPYPANEVFVTGTFDDWGKTVKLEQKGDLFEKQVHLPVTGEKVHFKFVVDGNWTTDNRLPQEDDGSSNVNNILYPDQIQADSVGTQQTDTAEMATISGVTPNATTAGLAGGVSKESGRPPGSTTAGLDKDVPLEQRNNIPGGFPAESPYNEYSVNPIPASDGPGNPIHLKPGEKVPDQSTFNSNTVQSTARTDKESYESSDPSRLAGPFSVPPVSNTMIPESSLPMKGETGAGVADPGYTVQSAHPESTTAGLAGNVPLESKKQTNSTTPADDVPSVVKDSLSKAHRDPEAAAHREVVEEKKELEHELQQKVGVENSAGTPAPTTAAATTDHAPRATVAEPSSAEMSPRTQTPTGARTSAPEETKQQTATSNDDKRASQVPSGSDSAGKEEKKKKRSSWFAKLKEKLK